MRKFHAGAVVWTDAVSFGGTSGQYDAHSTPHYPLVMFTVGLILRSDEKGISMAKEISADADLRGCLFIPRGMVQKEIIYKKNVVEVHEGKMRTNMEK
jgi:hypothetical protein